MSVDRLLTNTLALYQDVHDEAKTEQILRTTTTLLTQLSNPLNLSLLTSQLLIAPALWRRSDGLRMSYRIISIFNTAAIHVRRNEVEGLQRGRSLAGGGLSSEKWMRAVMTGVDDRSARWQHLLVFTGMLMGISGGEGPALSPSLEGTLQQAIITACNLALESGQTDGPTSNGAVTLALSYTFPLLPDRAWSSINFDELLSAVTPVIFGVSGLNGGQFLRNINLEVARIGQMLSWSEATVSFQNLHRLQQEPLISRLGPLSKVLAHAIQHARDSERVLMVLESLLAFTQDLFQQWQASTLGEVEANEESSLLTAETLSTTWPVLGQFLKRIMLAVVAILHSIVARSLLDANLSNHKLGPSVAVKSLHVLRNIYFISSQQGNSAFQIYNFTYLASIDYLAQYPDACGVFLQDIKTSTTSGLPSHPLQRTLDLFYLNVAEHLPLSLSCDACEALIVQPATVYLTHFGPKSARMVELLESAHSAMLSVLSCPHNALLTINLAPFYAETLFASFPAHISPRQFRLAFKTVLQIVSPPFPISATHPELAETLLEMIRYRVSGANPARLSVDAGAHGQLEVPSSMSEQSTLVTTLIDSLPFLQLDIVEEWMTLAAQAVGDIQDPIMREGAKTRFWDVLVSGEMDVQRAAIGVAWWGSKGGRELILHGRGLPGQAQFMMSGAIPDDAAASKL